MTGPVLSSGWALWVDGRCRLNHSYSFLGVEASEQTSTTPIPTADVTVKMLLDADEAKPGSGRTVTLWANGEQIGEGRLDRTIPISPSSKAGMDMGRDNGLVVDLAYGDKASYAFTGTLKNVFFHLKPATTHVDEKAHHEHASIHAVAHGVSAWERRESRAAGSLPPPPRRSKGGNERTNREADRLRRGRVPATTDAETSLGS